MDLDRGTLARIGRKLLSGLGHEEAFRTVRVPVAKAKWSTWKRRCDAARISMGRAIGALIESELAGICGESIEEGAAVLAERVEDEVGSARVTCCGA